MENMIVYILAPLVSGFAGWFANAYRNRQRKEADQIEVARQYKELLTDALNDKRALYTEIDKLRDEMRTLREEITRVKEERTLLSLAIAKTTRCEYASGCPVTRDLRSETTKLP